MFLLFLVLFLMSLNCSNLYSCINVVKLRKFIYNKPPGFVGINCRLKCD